MYVTGLMTIAHGANQYWQTIVTHSWMQIWAKWEMVSWIWCVYVKWWKTWNLVMGKELENKDASDPCRKPVHYTCIPCGSKDKEGWLKSCPIPTQNFHSEYVIVGRYFFSCLYVLSRRSRFQAFNKVMRSWRM